MKVLLGMDGSRYALAAVRFVAQHLSRAQTHVDVIHVLAGAADAPPQRGVRASDAARHRRTAALGWLEQAQKRLTSTGFDVDTLLRSGTPSRVLPTLAGRSGYDLVVVGAKGRSNVPFLELGSVALAALEHAPTNVLMVREREPGARKKQLTAKIRPLSVLFATDGGPHSRRALTTFFELFETSELDVQVATVIEEPEPQALRRLSRAQREPLLQGLKELGRERLEDAVERLRQQGVRARARALRGRPAQALVTAAATSESALMVLGSRGTAGPAGPRLGSVALAVARSAACSVLVVRER